MPDESPSTSGPRAGKPAPPRTLVPNTAHDSARSGKGKRSWRANLRALTTVITHGGRRSIPAEPRPRRINPLRRPDEQRSLFGEILDWMLAPLLLIWPLSVTITFLVAQTIANGPYDRHLSENLRLLTSYVRIANSEVALQLPLPVRDVLRADPTDRVNYMVLGFRGELVAGQRELPLPPSHETPAPGEVRLRFDMLQEEEVRIAYTWVSFSEGESDAQPALIQVAETLEKRAQLANEIVKGVIFPQFIVLPLAALLVWYSLSRGLAPLSALLARIRARRPDDLSPIDPKQAPEEMAPLVQAFNELLSRMAQNLAAQKRFTADAAHQMKTPLAGLRTQAELALRNADPQELARSLRQIGAATENATHVINQLLALARAENQATDLGAFEVVDLSRLAREVVQDFVPLAIARSMDLGFEAEPQDNTRVIGIALLLREMLKNLVDNALRYTPEGGTVTVRVRCSTNKNTVLLEVEDTGPGIPEAERHLVFERFYRVLGTNVEGSGLGLAIVREIVEQHDALLRVGFNPHLSGSAEEPNTITGAATNRGTLISVEFSHLPGGEPLVNLAAPR